MKNIIIKFIPLIVVVVICLQSPGFCRHTEKDLPYLEQLFMEEKYEKVIDEADGLIDSSSRQRDEIYYLKALSELKTARFDGARQTFGELILKYPNSRRVFYARMGIGDSYCLQNNPSAAISIYNDVIEKFPEESNIKIVRDRISQCHNKIGLGGTPNTVSGGSEKPFMAEKPVHQTTNFVPKSNFRPRTSARNKNEGTISVQVGSFKSRTNAQKFGRELSSKGYESYVDMPVGHATDGLYRVKVGKLNSIEKAEELELRLKKDGYSTKIGANN